MNGRQLAEQALDAAALEADYLQRYANVEGWKLVELYPTNGAWNATFTQDDSGLYGTGATPDAAVDNALSKLVTNGVPHINPATGAPHRASDHVYREVRAATDRAHARI